MVLPHKWTLELDQYAMLGLDPELVDIGPPNELLLLPNLYFMAEERMGVCIPPLPLSTEKEYKLLYTHAVLKYPSVNKSKELWEIERMLFKMQSQMVWMFSQRQFPPH